MKPLVLWCRWHSARLRLRGRNDEAVWGELVFPERTEPFHFELETARLSIGAKVTRRVVELDEMGVEREK